MRLSVFTVFDVAVNAFLRPFFTRSKGEAIRSFTEAVGDPKSEFCKHPDDYILYELGTFDDIEGRFEVLNLPLRVLTAREAQLERASGDSE